MTRCEIGQLKLNLGRLEKFDRQIKNTSQSEESNKSGAQNRTGGLGCIKLPRVNNLKYVENMQHSLHQDLLVGWYSIDPKIILKFLLTDRIVDLDLVYVRTREMISEKEAIMEGNKLSGYVQIWCCLSLSGMQRTMHAHAL